jgi:hypothetical protein
MMDRFRRKVDWVGVFVISLALDLLPYVLAAVMVDFTSVRSP